MLASGITAWLIVGLASALLPHGISPVFFIFNALFTAWAVIGLRYLKRDIERRTIRS